MEQPDPQQQYPQWWGVPLAPRRIWLWPNTLEEPLNEESDLHKLITVHPAELGLSQELQHRIEAWSSRFMDQEPTWDWKDPTEKARFRVEGFRLAADLQEALGPGIEVFYRDRLEPGDSFFRMNESSRF